MGRVSALLAKPESEFHKNTGHRPAQALAASLLAGRELKGCLGRRHVCVVSEALPGWAAARASILATWPNPSHLLRVSLTFSGQGHEHRDSHCGPSFTFIPIWGIGVVIKHNCF